MMSLADALDRYFAAWNDHDPDAVVRSLADGGSYQDPTTGGPLTGDALAANVATLLTGFPDLQFDLVSVAPTGDAAASATPWPDRKGTAHQTNDLCACDASGVLRHWSQDRSQRCQAPGGV